MTYSQLYINKPRHIPTFVGIVIICFVLFFFLRIFSRSTIPSRASKKVIPRVEIMNVSPNQVTIYWQSDVKETGWIIYGEKQSALTKIVSDERDIQTKKNPYRNHYAVLRNLQENHPYFFKIVSDTYMTGKTDGSAYEFTTPKQASIGKGHEPAYGKVIYPNTEPLENAVVIIKMDASYPLFTLSKVSGEWLIPLNTVYDSVTLQARTLSADEKLDIELISEENQISRISTTVSKVSPLPQTVVIGKDYGISDEPSVLSATTSNSAIKKTEIDIVYPKENALIPGFQPLIKGTALPGSEVFITIKSNSNLSSRVISDKMGIWHLTLPSNLLAGDYVITMQTKDKQNADVIVTRKFTIAKNGEQVLGDASASPTLTVKPTVAATPKITAGPTYAPTSTPKIPATSTPPVSGISSFAPLIGGASLIIMGIGLLLVF